jgi:regulator of sigma E protease
MELMIQISQMLLSLSILIVVHEWGHYFTARMFNIKVEKFYLFFDFLFPMANVLNFSLLKYKKGDTEYGIGWFPLGGYVKIAGMVDESMDKDQLKAEPQPWEFRSKPAWQRLIVMMGGIIVNVIVGVLIFIGITYFIGDTTLPKEYVNNNGGIYALELAEGLGLKTGDQIIKISGKDYNNFEDLYKPDFMLSENASYTVLRDGQEISIPIPENFIENFNSKEAASTFIQPRVLPIVGKIATKVDLIYNQKGEIIKLKKPIESIAKIVGLKKGDQFIEMEGSPVTYYDEVITILKRGAKDSISFKIKRGSEVLSFKESFKNQVQIGFMAKGHNKSDFKFITYSLAESIPLGTSRAFGVVWLQIKALGKFITRKLDPRKSLSGPVAMVGMFSPEWDWESLWRMTGLLSMVLAFMNFLPIPALDGGYVMFLLYEMISGREPSEKFFENSIKIGMAILLLLMVFVFYNDIVRAVTGG